MCIIRQTVNIYIKKPTIKIWLQILFSEVFKKEEIDRKEQKKEDHEISLFDYKSTKEITEGRRKG